ncbi:MAG: NAD-dependent epimerase/dehydratase family protein [Acidimicrobiales bacterium]
MGGAGAVVGLTGATGHIGGLLLGRLLADPSVEEVRTIARRDLVRPEAGARPEASGWRPRLVHVRADLREPAARRALAGADVVYHLAAQVWQGYGRGARPEMEAANVAGTRNVLAGRPAAVVLASSASVYGAWPDNPLPLTEAQAPRPNPECPYGSDKLRSEQICAEAAGRYVVVRLAAVLGPHADARVARSVRGYRLAVPEVRGAPQAVQWLDEADAVEALLAAGRAVLEARGVTGEVVNVATADWLGAGDSARLARSRVVRLPRPALMAVSELGRRWRLVPFGADRAALIGGPLALSVAKAQALLGWRPTRTSAQVLAVALGRDWRASPRNRAV